MNTPTKILTCLVINLFWLSAYAQQGKPDSAASSPRIVYTVVQQQPEFPGGMSKLNQYFKKNLRYPQSARESRLEGKIFVTFIVNEQGNIEDARVLRSFDPEMDTEAVRLIQEMPTWIPGKQNGKPVNCRFNLPVNFAL